MKIKDKNQGNKLVSWSPLMIAAIYFGFSFLWIFFSDRLVESMYADAHTITQLQTYKGILFIFISTLIIFLLVHKEIKRKNKVIQFLYQSDQRYHKLTNSLPDTNVYLYNRQLESLLPAVSDKPSLENFIEWKPGKSIADIFGESEREAMLSITSEVFLGKESKGVFNLGKNYFEVRCSPLPDADGDINTGIAVIIDITAHKKAEIELKDRNLFIESIMDSVPVGFAVRYNKDTNFSYLNKQFQLIHNWPEEMLWDLRAYTDHVIIDPRIRNEILQALFSDDMPDQYREWNQVEIAQQNGQRSIVYIRIILLPAQDFLIFTVQDITELKQTEIELEEAKRGAEEADKLKTAFLANMSHEIRTPLNSLIGFTEILASGDFPPQKREKFVNTISQSGNYLTKIIEDMIKMAKIDSGQFKIKEETFNLNQLLRNIFKWFERNVDFDHEKITPEYRVDLEERDSNVLIDPVHVREIFEHLLSNAAKYTSEGTIAFGYSIQGDKIQFEVKDTGVGINKDEHEIIFDRFNQIKRANPENYAGTGLGLTICKHIIELMEGNIWVESEKGKGSSFYFTVPYKPFSKGHA
ncbi:MAG: hypothetical protein K9I94_04620 [Bacteroidales bacterium]|nr:hypothetical protein [Bacteroidales bacterium]